MHDGEVVHVERVLGRLVAASQTPQEQYDSIRQRTIQAGGPGSIVGALDKYNLDAVILPGVLGTLLPCWGGLCEAWLAAAALT